MLVTTFLVFFVALITFVLFLPFILFLLFLLSVGSFLVLFLLALDCCLILLGYISTCRCS